MRREVRRVIMPEVGNCSEGLQSVSSVRRTD
jgi:hypothetical protein